MTQTETRDFAGTEVLGREAKRRGTVTRKLSDDSSTFPRWEITWEGGQQTSIHQSDLETQETNEIDPYGGWFRNADGVLQVRRQR